MNELFIEPYITFTDGMINQIFHWLNVLEIDGAVFEELNREKMFEMRAIGKQKNIFVWNRKTLHSQAKNPNEIDSIRSEFDLLVFKCTTPDLTKWACQDQRIDLLSFSLENINQLADDSTINLAVQNGKGIEIEFNEIIQRKNPIGLLRNIKKVTFKAAKKNLPIVFSSRAKNPMDLRSKFSVLGFLDFLDFDENYYSNISQSWFHDRLERNIERKKSEFISPGIRLKIEDEV